MEDYGPYMSQIAIFRPIRIDTLASLMEYPVKWVDGRHTKTHAIKGVTSVTIDAQGALLPPADGKEEFAFRNLSKSCGFTTTGMAQERMESRSSNLPASFRSYRGITSRVEGVFGSRIPSSTSIRVVKRNSMCGWRM